MSFPMSQMSPDKYGKPPQSPPLFNGTAESIETDTKSFCDKYRALLDKLAAEVSPEDAKFNNTLLLVARQRNEQSGILSFYRHVSPDPAIRQASTAAVKARGAFAVECLMRDDFFKLLDAAWNKNEELDEDSKMLLYENHREGVRNGLALPPGPTRDRLKEIMETLTTLGADFSKNMVDDNGGIWFTPEELRGVGEDDLANFEKGTKENDGRFRVTFKTPDVMAVMKYAEDPETRKKVFIARENRCPDNIAIFKMAIDLRAEAAQLRDFANHAAYKLEIKMAKDTDTVMNFINDLRDRALKRRPAALDELLALKKEDLGARSVSFDGKLYSWDSMYYGRVLKEKKYNVDQLEIAQYFSLGHSVQTMLDLFGELFGLVFIKVQDDEDRANISSTGRAADIVWHEDVLLFSVWNADDTDFESPFVGYLYLDLHPRPGKYTHAMHVRIRAGFDREDGTRNYPAAAIVANFTKPTAGGKPSLLKHNEFTTLFHEIGHGIHNLVTRTTYADHHMMIVRDFVEAPSQMLENWCWIPSMLKRFSSHWKTGEPIPDDLAARLVATKHAETVRHVLGQLRYNYFDMKVHMRKPEDPEINFAELYNRMATELTGLEGPETLGMLIEWGHGYASWTHLMGGYDAGYYGYLWSDVFATDMFYTAFKKDPVNREQGLRYRRKVLEKGSSREPMDLLEDFLGRKPNTDAFYEELEAGEKS